MTLMGDSPCECADYLVGTGQVKRVEVAWLAFAVAGISPNYRRAVEKGIPRKIEVREFSNYTMGLRFLAGAMGLPFMSYKIAYRLIHRRIQRHDQGDRRSRTEAKKLR